jgi:D-ribose pyranase
VRANGLWHPALLGYVARLGHGQTLVVADAGLPVPREVDVVDLVWSAGQPAFLPVVAALAGELVVESALVAKELTDERIRAGLAEHLPGVPIDEAPHEELKCLVADALVVVRTGETTPFANVVLTAGVAF